MDRQVPSSGWVPLARRTRYRYANLPSGPAIDSNRNMRCAAPGRSMKGLRTRCSQQTAPPLSTNCSWNGAGFTAGDSLLWAVNAYTGGNGPMTLTFASGIIGAGALIQSDVPGQFTASLHAFNGGTSLGRSEER